MLAFFVHKKFWMPIALLLITGIVIELFFRSGLYNRFLSPNSLMGNTFNQISVVKRFGVDDVDWITIGDSKTDWGINHKFLKNERKKDGVNHIRFSLAGSNFMTLQSSTEWSINNFKNLEGIMIGMYEFEFVRHSNFNKEYKISWPFKKYWNFDKFDYFNQSNYKVDVIKKLALSNYHSDFQNLLINPIKRYQMKEAADKRWKKYINFNKKSKVNLCEYDISDLPSCVALGRKFKENKSAKQFGIPVKNCKRRSSIERLKMKQWLTDPIDLEPHFENWSYLFDQILKQNKKIKLVMLPEYEFFEYMGKPSNAYQLVDMLTLKYSNNKNFSLIDLRELFNVEDECNYYSDVLHFNSKGIQVITDAIVNALRDGK